MLLIDNDAFILLAGAGALRSALGVLGFSVDDCRRLLALEYMLRRPSQSLRRYPAEVLSRALEECSRVRPLDDVPSGAFRGVFEKVTDVDAGEALLFSLAAERTCYFLASNDKRAMRSVASDDRLHTLRDAVAGRIICMELVLSRLLDSEGAESVARWFGGPNAVDKRYSAILSAATSGRPQDCKTGVESFLRALNKDLGTGFLMT